MVDDEFAEKGRCGIAAALQAKATQRERRITHMPTQTTVLFGIPIPSANPLFLSVVGIHVLFALAAVVCGAAAMLSVKGSGRHVKLGMIYFWCLFGAFVTMSALAFTRWQEDYHLFILGALRSVLHGWAARSCASAGFNGLGCI